jgi:predicted metal-dependent peptidase
MGLVYMLCGITDTLGMYWNKQTANAGARLCIGIYMDVSGSMIRHFPLVAAFVDALKEVPLRVRTFDTEVRAIEVQDLARGNIKGGGGTDFNAPVRDMLDDRELSAGVLFTDGEGQLSSDLGRRLAQSGKRLYIVYLGATRPDISLHRFATDTITVPSTAP